MLGKHYYIVDMSCNYYKLNDKGGLAVAKDSDDAFLFTLKEANCKIGTGRKSRFYQIIEAPDAVCTHFDEAAVDKVVAEAQYEAPELDTVEKPTMFDSLHNDWETILSNLCYMSEHIAEYQNNLKQMLSDVDKEICDLMHYLELEDLDDAEMLNASKMIQDRRRHRREIKDEMEKTALMRDTFLDSEFGIKVQQSLEVMEHMKNRLYTPRKLNDLFKQQTA